MKWTGILSYPKCSDAVQSVRQFVIKHKNGLLLLWDIFMFSVVGLNSFILLLYRHGNHSGLKYVICAGATSYLFVLLIQTIFLRRKTGRRQILFFTKKIFRLIYTAIYLTAIMLDVLTIAEVPGKEWQLSYNGFLFIWVILWGTNFLWLKQVYQFLKSRFDIKQKKQKGLFDMGIKQTLTRTALGSAMEFISGNPQQNLPKLLGLIESMGWDKAQTDVFHKILEDPDNIWYQYAMNLWRDIDNEILKTVFCNFGLSATFFGMKEQKKNAENTDAIFPGRYFLIQLRLVIFIVPDAGLPSMETN